jgi:hypothetical protein
LRGRGGREEAGALVRGLSANCARAMRNVERSGLAVRVGNGLLGLGEGIDCRLEPQANGYACGSVDDVAPPRWWSASSPLAAATPQASAAAKPGAA